MAEDFDIKKFLTKGKDTVIDLNGVEYLVDDTAVKAITRGEKHISLLQLYDGREYLFKIIDVQNSLMKNGAIDYLDKRN